MSQTDHPGGGGELSAGEGEREANFDIFLKSRRMGVE